MFYLIGLGLNLNSLTREALSALKKCKKIYLENYTVDFPYTLEELREETGEFEEVGREFVEKEEFVLEARKKDIALLVYGDVLAATTHISLVLRCEKEEIKYKIIHNAGIFNAISETGLQMYKFGKTASLPKWQENFTPDSFAEIIRDNLKIKAHTLLLVDIGLDFKKAREELRTACGNKKVFLDKILVCSSMGTDKKKIYYERLDNLPEDIERPFCLIIPSNLHEMEKTALAELANL
ncbi:MAG: diphthine synthase [Nanoarchaeota archaeon]|nr:diphthine synthase [Nanoarchaeota archaeon]MBU4086900.1 diphthine synthase [Nanoarchaeota archaeon]